MNTCIDCKKRINNNVSIAAQESVGVPLCERHLNLMQRLSFLHETPVEAIQLYYGLKEAGASPMLEWWDGIKSVDIALSRVRLNLEIDTEYQMFSCDMTMDILENRMYSYKDGFTTIRIPHMLVRQCLPDTISAVMAIVEGLRARNQVVPNM